MVVYINNKESYDGHERYVCGTIDLDGNNLYKFELQTDDGFTSIHLLDNSGRFADKTIYCNLEDEDDCDLFNIEDGYEVYDFILDDVNFKGYDFIGEEFE